MENRRTEWDDEEDIDLLISPQ
jgi:hypothetical protein